jgi:hypothetical protein
MNEVILRSLATVSVSPLREGGTGNSRWHFFGKWSGNSGKREMVKPFHDFPQIQKNSIQHFHHQLLYKA